MPKLADIVLFRRDLLFNGAVQLGWLETDRALAEKAARHFAFHGPQYHGAARDASQGDAHQLRDTASFTVDVLRRLTRPKPDEPFVLAVAGYGTGKSHLGVTLAGLLEAPDSAVAKCILDNLSSADKSLGNEARAIMTASKRPFLVVALNGMKDFDLTGEVVRQVMVALRQRDLDTSPLDNLRPRFKQATSFVSEEMFRAFSEDFVAEFGAGCSRDEILDGLRQQDEAFFERVDAIFQRRGFAPIRAAGQESIHDFLSTVRESYCGEDKPFAGLLIIFDEFGRYMEFAVQRPRIAGPGALQQLYEAVQANGEGVFLLDFIQYELRAYVSRVAPELRDDLERYVSRYDLVPKVRLSTNLETLIANLLQKTDHASVAQHLAAFPESPEVIRGYMKKWFPDLNNHAVWADPETFDRVVQRGCWPLHPLSTWLLFKLASVGKSLHQRSALSLLADAYDRYAGIEPELGFSIPPADLCSEDLVSEFVASERIGQQGPSAQAFQAAFARHEHVLSDYEARVLKSVLLLAKIGASIPQKGDWPQALALFGGCTEAGARRALASLELERGVLTWNEGLGQYEILSEGVPRAKFRAWLEGKAGEISTVARGQLFSANFARWFPDLAGLATDFGADSNIATKEWNYAVSFSNVALLPSQIEIAVSQWLDARGVDEAKGRLIYGHVGPDSDLPSVRLRTETHLRTCLEKAGVRWDIGAPIAVCLLSDADGGLGEKVAQYSVLRGPMDPTDVQRFANFLQDEQETLEQELRERFEQLRKRRLLVCATSQSVAAPTLKAELTRLFDVVYSCRVPFPFDGFSVPGGVAARASQQFTRQLFLGQFDRDWIATRNAQEKNRAHEVLVQSWQVLDPDGRLRIRPGNPAVQKQTDLLDSFLADDSSSNPGQFNLGKAFRILCLPPYGCNLASAGLLLALFFGGRKDSLGLLKAGQSIAMESWLQAAMPHNYLELAVLDQTDVLQIQAPDEWVRLLNDWGLETTYSGRLAYLHKARELETRIPVPQSQYYKYEGLSDKAQAAGASLVEHRRKVKEALDRVDSGLEQDRFSLLSWGAAELASLAADMRANGSLWTGDELGGVEQPLAHARLEVQRRFSVWLPNQRETRLIGWADWEHKMNRVGWNLTALKLPEEKAALDEHVEGVQSAIRFLAEVETLASEVQRVVGGNTVSDATDILTLESLLQKASEFEDRVAQAQQHDVLSARPILATAQTGLNELKRRCTTQLAKHKGRLEDVYNWDMTGHNDVSDLRATVAELKRVFAGQEADLASITEIAKELDIVDAEYQRLDSDALTDEELDAQLAKCSQALQDIFDGEPPLYCDPYEGIAATIRKRRRHTAEEWMQANLPAQHTVAQANAEQARAFKVRLHTAPRLLAAFEARLVGERIADCERRLDELEVEGMLARFDAIQEPERRKFLRAVRTHGLLANLCRQSGCAEFSPAGCESDPADLACRCRLLQD